MRDKLEHASKLSDVELMQWYGRGRTFQDILKALQTSHQVEISAGELLSRSETQSWYEIWDELGIQPLT